MNYYKIIRVNDALYDLELMIRNAEELAETEAERDRVQSIREMFDTLKSDTDELTESIKDFTSELNE